MKITEFLNTFSDLIEQRTGTPVLYGPPDAQSAGPFLWVWKVTENTATRAAPPLNTGSGTALSVAMQPLNIHFIVIAATAFTPAGLGQLEEVFRLVAEKPLLTSGTGSARLIMEILSNDHLATLFGTAGQPVSACACVQATLQSEVP